MSITASTLAAARCIQPIEALDDAAIASHLAALPDWKIDDGKLARTFAFSNYYQTLAFVNAMAWIIHAEDHHPELVVTYNRCQVKFDTHSVNAGRGGLSANDFICAAKVDALFAQRANA
ncbi:4a-hydroxytetrahydrobiopterin dehydratase [Herbaspirillum rubrisubalbicans]|uniref:Putative pterin-4-alpha-carbinolamine dehydratase n=1 Tax=Herbaspirillum rubrisubalbicans TaxID=80842 RepID=A0AAD0U6G5_9BURK|nr:4a-hydroxytetrahydrobiopterin dehydratase [Herbaspirillum rubrisubalbicans]ALU88468.1 pterin-4-alpha-carbinolamine dehydratase protein [Herbaspirillum rubrisubalbicans M1]AYR23553.1 4a-hydroxytetrahydrobiopterin dehydratase [Herbaspirillum rubrisubalbicans]